MLNRFELAKVTHYLNRTKINENNIVPIMTCESHYGNNYPTDHQQYC